jgi:predicted MPP superfamily phosphohydrolase
MSEFKLFAVKVIAGILVFIFVLWYVPKVLGTVFHRIAHTNQTSRQ